MDHENVAFTEAQSKDGSSNHLPIGAVEPFEGVSVAASYWTNDWPVTCETVTTRLRSCAVTVTV